MKLAYKFLKVGGRVNRYVAMPNTTSKSKAGSPNPSTTAAALLCSHLVKIQSASRLADQDALLERISETSAVVSLARSLKRGSGVKIDCGRCELHGTVTGCERRGREFVVEIAFPKDQPWQPAEFKPDALFNPNYLVCENPGCTPDCVACRYEIVETAAKAAGAG
jgi:hypothetical protein